MSCNPTRAPARLIAAYAGPARGLAAYLATLTALATAARTAGGAK